MTTTLDTLALAAAAALNADALAELDCWSERELIEYAADHVNALARTWPLWVTEADQAVAANAPAVTYPKGHWATIAAAWNGVLLRPATVAELEALDANWMAATAPAPRLFVDHWLGNDLARLYPVPTLPGTLSLVARVEPGAPATGADVAPCPDVLADSFTFVMLRQARAKETDAQMMDVVEAADSIIGLYAAAIAAWWSA